MRGVVGLLLLAIGLEIAYLVLAGKLPLGKKSSGSSGTGGGPDSLDLRKVIPLPVVGMNKPAAGHPLFTWKGLI